MFSAKFANIIDRQPASAHSLTLVAEYLDSAASQKRLNKLRLDPKIIQKISKVDSSAELAQLISILIAEHVLKRVVVVESPAGGGIAEFPSMDEVPETVHDQLRDIWMRVTPGDIRTVYTLQRPDDA